MKVYKLNIRGFRGFETLEISPSEHVMLAGEPRAGRTTVTDAMTRCLDPDSTRRTVDPWDFHDRDLDRRIDIELTLGELGDDLEQRFGDYLEVFDRANRELVAFAENPEALDSDTHEWVLRVAWRAQWDSDEGVGTSWLDYPKVSDPDRGRAVRVTRSDRQALPFLAVTRSRPLAIRTEGAFRRLLNAYADTAALSAAVDTLAEEIETAAAVFSADATVVTALEKVLEPLRATLDLEAPAQDVVRFAPEGGTLTGLLRSLAPVFNLGSPDLLLPLERHGSTLSALLSAAELQLLPAAAETVVVIDDFGDQLDSASAEYLAATIRRAAGQAWISTRRPDVGRAFNPGELVRLAGSPPKAYSLNQATGIAHRSAVRQFNLQLLPAMTSRVVVICEGQHDATTLRALSERLMRRDGVEPPAARGVALIEAGGIEAVPKLCQVAAELGFRTVAILDHDKPGQQADGKLTAVEAVADAIVRLPERSAIEAALVAGLSPVILRWVMRRLKAGFGLPWPDPGSLDDDELAPFLVKNLKGRGGLHQPFVQLLPSNVDPPRLRALLHEMLRLAAGVDETVELSE